MLIRPGSPSFVTRLRDALSATICSVGIAAAATLGAATLPPGFTETPLATGLFSPTAMALVPDGRVFVAEQGGTLRVVKNGALLAASFFIRTVLTDGERGLLGVAVDPSEQLRASLRPDELVEGISLAVPFDVAEAQRVDLNDVPAEHLDQGQHASRVGDDHAILHMKLARFGRKLETGQYRVLGLCGDLVLPKLGHILVAPCVAVLGIVDDPATDLAAVNHVMDDVGTGRALAHALDLVAFEFLLEALEQIDLGAFA